MKLKTLSTAILLATVPMTGVFAAAMDRSGQSISAFLQPGNYFEAGISVLDPTVEGQEAGTSATQRNISDMAGDYYFPSAALKFQPTNKLSFGILYDQPFGADAEYTGDNVFVSDSTNTILAPAALAGIRQNTINTNFNALTAQQRVGAVLQAQGVDLTTQAGQLQLQGTLTAYNADPATKATIDAAVLNGVTQQVDAGLANVNGLLGTGNTSVEVDTQNLSFIAGFQPTENWNIYAGPVYQTVKGKVSLRGQAYSIFNGYDSNIKETDGIGWLAGIAYQIPEIALKASLTYRSEIDHDVNINENIPTLPALALLPNGAAAAAAIAAASGETKITTPQSVNLDFQTGIMANTVAFANVRWVDWSSFSIRPYKFGLLSEAVGPLVQRPNGFNLVEYSDDQISATVGVGRKLSEQWAGNVSVGWDSGAGNPVSTLGPTEGYWNVGLGVQFSPAPNYFIAGGVKYFMLGDAKAQTGAQAGGDEYVAKFEDNDALAYGLKIGYRF
ncbi:outer membrane protein transport protein [Acinetobacter terrae]|jgi:long-chain fatty acid transport protein|uniref:Long-chain fatty acid transporter n=1 Tax=Acinetobacter terrae TaxID=2731247 RepID=A0A4R0EQB4_9GAMM|nr:outer membrane protein transport protein [Acinetobacter terrae]TCB60243.1 long-chain fatty acid transporter [Acinetobacter terrae]